MGPLTTTRTFRLTYVHTLYVPKPRHFAYMIIDHPKQDTDLLGVVDSVIGVVHSVTCAADAVIGVHCFFSTSMFCSQRFLFFFLLLRGETPRRFPLCRLTRRCRAARRL